MKHGKPRFLLFLEDTRDVQMSCIPDLLQSSQSNRLSALIFNGLNFKINEDFIVESNLWARIIASFNVNSRHR